MGTSRQVGVCAWYWLFTILSECVVSSEIGTKSKIETHRCKTIIIIVSPRIPLVEILMITNQGYQLLMVKLS